MNLVALKFQRLRETGKKAFIPYIMGGDPDLARLPRLLECLAKSGVDLIEVGVPFSDPLADGPVIQSAGARALQNGCTLGKLLDTLKPVAFGLGVPVILMIYYNQVLQRGLNRFMEEAKEAGCAGLIIPDLPPDAGGELRELANNFEIGLNFLVAPTSKDERIKAAAQASTGFLYAVSLKGVTGVRNNLPPELPDFIGQVKRLSERPVAVGFGIATPEQARLVSGLADGVIVGSAIVKAAAENAGLDKVQSLVKELREAI
ncbi:MAG: tryptophan synthase subunit alpha [Firmicutes bacterium]|mgnify:CR=1 FL=1|nr:tryptophan synthase subunit alpha [Bacillota bacterium]